MTYFLRGLLRTVVPRKTFSKQTYILRKFSNRAELSQSKPQDIAMTTLKTAITPSDVISFVQTQPLGHKYLLQALRTIFELQKDESSKENSKMLIQSPGFSVLCQNFNKHARALDVNEAIEVTKILSYLKVPVNSLILQTMLQMIRCNINKLSIRQVMFFDFLLSKFDTKNHLVDALKLALPLVFQIHLPLELDKDDVPLLKDMLAFSCAHDLPDRCINNIVTGLLLHDNFDVKTAKSVLWSLSEGNCTAELYPSRVKLLNICFGILTRSMEQLTFDDVSRTAAKVRSRILEKHPEYYNERFMDAIGDYVIDNELDFERSVLIARVLSRIGHTHLGLAAHVCQQAITSPTTLIEAPTNLLFGFVNFLSNNNYVPEKKIWSELRRQLSRHPIMDSKTVTLPWTKFSLELASLGHYEDTLLSRIFSKEFLHEYLNRENNNLDYLQILTLHEAVKTFHNDGFRVPEEVIEKAKSLYPIHSVTDEIVQCLGRGLGGPQYVVQNVVLKNGIVADALISLKGGYPQKIDVANRESKLPIDQLNIPDSNIIICILNFSQGCYSMNSNRLRGIFQLVLNIIEKQGYAAVPINTSELNELLEHERVPYLIREVGYKCSEIGMKLNTV